MPKRPKAARDAGISPPEAQAQSHSLDTDGDPEC